MDIHLSHVHVPVRIDTCCKSMHACTRLNETMIMYKYEYKYDTRIRMHGIHACACVWM